MQVGEGKGVAASEVEVHGGAAAGDGSCVSAGAYGDAAGRLLPVGGIVADDGFAGAAEVGAGAGDGDYVGGKICDEGVFVEEGGVREWCCIFAIKRTSVQYKSRLFYCGKPPKEK